MVKKKCIYILRVSDGRRTFCKDLNNLYSSQVHMYGAINRSFSFLSVVLLGNYLNNKNEEFSTHILCIGIRFVTRRWRGGNQLPGEF